MLGLMFQVGTNHLALDVGRVREIVPCVRLQPVACGPTWLAGVFIYRGQVVPVVDLHRLLGAGECPVHLSTRIILVPHRVSGQERLVGLLAAKVAEVREMPTASATPHGLGAAGRLDLGSVLVDAHEIIHLVELDRLVPELSDQELALIAKEPSP
jgi:chemotaxis-related protein WspB